MDAKIITFFTLKINPFKESRELITVAEGCPGSWELIASCIDCAVAIFPNRVFLTLE